MSVLSAPAVALLASFLFSALLMRHGARLGLQDLPNARSSHRHPTPRGGGIAILAGFLLALAWHAPERLSAGWTVWLPLSAAIMLALVGLADDLRRLGLSIRLAAQTLAVAALFAALAGGVPSAAGNDTGLAGSITGLAWFSGWFSGWLSAGLPAGLVPAATAGFDLLLAALLMRAAVWWINLFNFMDGIDGLAASQALFMLLAALAIKSSGSGMEAEADAFFDAPASAASLALAAAVAGFLLLNWAPARLFLGDAGSLFLGFCLLAAAAHDVTYGDMSLWSWLILGALFLVDATVTLLRRWLTGCQVTAAHRSHLYQRLSRRGGHSQVALVYCLLNIAWIFPLALLAHHLPGWAPMIMVFACLPLALVAWRAGAGLNDT